MKQFLALLLIGTGLFLAACESTPATSASTKPTAVDSLRTVVMDLHNAEMGKMGEIIQLKRQLKDMLASEAGQDEASGTAWGEALTLLDSADFSMKSWMRNWAEPDSTLPQAEQIAQLQQQLESMEATRDLMNAAIQQATAYLPAP